MSSLTTCSATACCTKTSKSSSFGTNKLTFVANSASARLFGTNLTGSSSSAGSGSYPKRADLELRGRVLRSGLKKAIPACLKSVAGFTGHSLILVLNVSSEKYEETMTLTNSSMISAGKPNSEAFSLIVLSVSEDTFYAINSSISYQASPRSAVARVAKLSSGTLLASKASISLLTGRSREPSAKADTTNSLKAATIAS